ncbi:transposase [Enterobacter hormaechei]|uniref:RNA-guided endonuclease InsQ/TnpB family protein n=1 Tax=Enterobacter hormaechei TaxID=158836 RepID=UPI00190DE941|nr:RNA-guided endonuclease TnpB family protein [Enterobacter hormaechei]MBK2821875.1 transposase [Enterobacter hormaechei]
MIKKQAFKFLLEPNKNHINEFLVFTGSCRFVYNKGLALINENYDSGKKFLNYNQLASELVNWKNEECLAWLKMAPSQCLQQSLRDLDKAFKNFFSGKSQYPRFKKKGRNDSFRVPCQRVRLDQEKNLVSLPKLGWVKYRKSREITGVLKNVTISRKLDKWYISFNTEAVVPEPVHPSFSKTKILLNNECIMQLTSNESLVEQFTSMEGNKKLRNLNNILGRKVKYSSNWLKTKKKIDSVKARSSRRRLDALHKITTAICKKHAIVELVNLTDSLPDKSNGFVSMGYEFVRQLMYKQEWLGGQVIRLGD